MSRISALTSMLAAILAWLVAAPAAQAPSGGRQSAATITGAFADSCRDFNAHSSQDISDVELHYVTGFVFKNESIASHDHSIDGNAGDEIKFAAVKSGTEHGALRRRSVAHLFQGRPFSVSRRTTSMRVRGSARLSGEPGG